MKVIVNAGLHSDVDIRISGPAGNTGCDLRLPNSPVSGSVKSWNSGKVTGEVRLQPSVGHRRDLLSTDVRFGGLREAREEESELEEATGRAGRMYSTKHDDTTITMKHE